ncbi:DUF4435 domain-containing protein [Mesorhizobium sp. VK4C]|uniref:DUF4435 domain-containing protein n=1 Tax=Mesorhizobium captivum TaxID=3072319 RepID=UPI002A247DCE|nr:DUF4435 domain-containing protein [Mesorhizobium sp. VK4C]MDX8496897.1 DUF4435 domain-containing protein [Mesorhizobium sp. VK4C]
MNEIPEAVIDAYLDRLKSGRNRPAVLKHQLVSLRGQLPRALIFAFEGDDDKMIYYQWIRQIRPDMEFEPFPCRGKRSVLEFREMLKRDLNNLGDGVYFFVDRDFDDLIGYDHDDKTFMTDYYATENYLVCDKVLEQTLKNEFNCHSRVDVRRPIVDLFVKVYNEFLFVTRDLNYRIFVAKRFGIALETSMPQKLNSYATIELTRIKRGGNSPEELVVYSREPTPEELAAAEAEFSALVPAHRFRGKFAFSFFERWLSLLADDYSAEASVVFGDLDRNSKVRRHEMVLNGFASKSPHPEGLAAFLSPIVVPA